MNAESRPKTLLDYMRILRRHVWLILGTTVLAAVVALALTVGQSKSYAATATVNFTDPSSQAGQVGGQASTTAAATLSAAGVARMTQNQTLSEVKRQLRTPLTVNQLRNDLTTSVNPTTNLVTVTATSTDAAFAAHLANAVVARTKADGDRVARAEFAGLARQVERQFNTLPRNQSANALTRNALVDRATTAQALAHTASTASIESAAQIPSSTSSPSPIVDAIIGALLGFLLGILLAAVRESFDRRLSGPGEIESELGLPYLGQVREDALGSMRVNGGGPASFAPADLEAFRILRTNMDFLAAGNPPRTVAVTSALPEEGKTTVASSLAYASAVAGRSTLLVECDLRRPALPGRLGVAQAPGLSDYLAHKAEPADVLRTVHIGGSTAETNGDSSKIGPPPGEFVVVPAGSPTDQAAELLGSPRFREFLAEVSNVYDLVVLDTSPLLPVADTLELLTLVDAVLMCVRASRTTRDQARAAKTTLDRFPPKPTGIVVTGLRDPHEAHSYAYEYHRQPDAAPAGSASSS